MLYPILDLQALNPDLHWYLRQLEQVGHTHIRTDRHHRYSWNECRGVKCICQQLGLELPPWSLTSPVVAHALAVQSSEPCSSTCCCSPHPAIHQQQAQIQAQHRTASTSIVHCSGTSSRLSRRARARWCMCEQMPLLPQPSYQTQPIIMTSDLHPHGARTPPTYCWQVVIEALDAVSGLHGERVEGLTGVWVGGAKVSAIGVRAKRYGSAVPSRTSSVQQRDPAAPAFARDDQQHPQICCSLYTQCGGFSGRHIFRMTYFGPALC